MPRKAPNPFAEEVLSQREALRPHPPGPSQPPDLHADEAVLAEAAEAVSRQHDKLPARFREAEAWEYGPKNKNPLYQTVAQQYGAKAPTKFEMPLEWHGTKQTFSKVYGAAGNWRNHSLNVG